MLTRTLFAVVLFAVLKCCHAQPLPVISVAGSPVPSVWYPTNATTARLVWWLELQPIMGAYTNNVGAPVVALDADQVKMWTNFAAGFNGIQASSVIADQATHPTNFVSGGGGNGTSRRISWSNTGSKRMHNGGWPTVAGSGSTNLSTWIFVFNDNSSSGTQWILSNTATAPWVIWNAKGFDYNQGSATVSTARTLTVGQFYIVAMFFAAGASSHLDTNGVQMVAGTGGTSTMGPLDIDQGNGSAPLNGNISRVWIYEGILGSTDYNNAVAQCKKDFGIQ